MFEGLWFSHQGLGSGFSEGYPSCAEPRHAEDISKDDDVWLKWPKLEEEVLEGTPDHEHEDERVAYLCGGRRRVVRV